MSSIGWRFPPLSGGTRQGYSNYDIEGFKGDKQLCNLVREICQNSLDAHLDNSKSPVIVKFELKRFMKTDFDLFSQYSECLESCKNFWGKDMDEKLSNFIKSAERSLNEETIPILIASDYNTKGLCGSHNREKISSSWEALTNSDGFSVKQERNSAGSYGIGKNAPFASSSLSMVFYNTLADDGESAFIGVTRLATLKNKWGKETQRVGKYQYNDDDNEIWRPIYNTDKNSFRDHFARTEIGTDIIIVGFNQEPNWTSNVTMAVLQNFFIAISEGGLVVELKDDNEHIVINDKTLSQLFSKYSSANKDMVSATQLYNAYTNPDCKRSFKVLENDDVEIYVKSDSSFKKKLIANFRSTGMLIYQRRRNLTQNYAAVVIVRGNKLGALLKDTEPPQHDKWDPKQIDPSDKEKRDYAENAIKSIFDIVDNFLQEQFGIPTKDKVDAKGVGKYLQGDYDELEEQSDGNEIQKPKVKIGKVITNNTVQGRTTKTAHKDEGSAQEGEVHNHKKNPKPLTPRDKPPKPVIDNPDDPNPQQGAKPGSGTKTILTPQLSAQRAFPVDSSQGIYKVIIVPEEDYNNLYIEFYAIGEDKKSDPLELVSFNYDETSINVSNGKAGPFSLRANKPVEFFATFLKKEKMKLKLHITEEVMI